MRWIRKDTASLAANIRITGQKHERNTLHVVKSSTWAPGGGSSLLSTPACFSDGPDLDASAEDEEVLHHSWKGIKACVGMALEEYALFSSIN